MKKLLWAALLLLSIGGKAQGILSMINYPPDIDGDTIQSGHVDTSYVILTNTDAVNFTGNIALKCAVRNDINPWQLDSIGIGYTSPPPETIPADDSVIVPLILTYDVLPGRLRYGIDVIVVWPVSDAVTGDSLEYMVYIEHESGIGELDVNEIIRLYPNPSSEKISIAPTGTAQVEQVTIYDLRGRVVLSRRQETCIDIDALAPGIYTVDIVLSDKKHYSLKFIRQKNSSE